MYFHFIVYSEVIGFRVAVFGLLFVEFLDQYSCIPSVACFVSFLFLGTFGVVFGVYRAIYIYYVVMCYFCNMVRVLFREYFLLSGLEKDLLWMKDFLMRLRKFLLTYLMMELFIKISDW